MKTLNLLPHSALSDRILDTFPSGAYALSGLLRLMDIVETTTIPTAAVECRARPRMLINPEFVAQHAATPEKLLMRLSSVRRTDRPGRVTTVLPLPSIVVAAS